MYIAKRPSCILLLLFLCVSIILSFILYSDFMSFIRKLFSPTRLKLLSKSFSSSCQFFFLWFYFILSWWFVQDEIRLSLLWNVERKCDSLNHERILNDEWIVTATTRRKKHKTKQNKAIQVQWCIVILNKFHFNFFLLLFIHPYLHHHIYLCLLYNIL